MSRRERSALCSKKHPHALAFPGWGKGVALGSTDEVVSAAHAAGVNALSCRAQCTKFLRKEAARFAVRLLPFNLSLFLHLPQKQADCGDRSHRAVAEDDRKMLPQIRRISAEHGAFRLDCVDKRKRISDFAECAAH